MASKLEKTKLALLFTFIFIFAALPLHAAAQAEPPASNPAAGGAGVGFYVRAVIPENQIDTRLSYFDLRMQPGQNQLLEVEIVNETDGEIGLDITNISASTNANGIIDYRTPDIRDETLDIPFSEISEVETPRVTIPAGGTARAAVRIQMPENEYDGTVLGGIVMTRRDDENETTGEGGDGAGVNTDSASLQNIYNYVIGVKLTETDAEVPPDFDLVNVMVESVNYYPAYVHYLRNKEAAIVKHMDVEVQITREGETQPILTETRTNLDMAPNSVMPLAMTADGNIEEGTYNTVVIVRTEDDEWRFERTFIVGRGEVDEANQLPGTNPGGIPYWIIVLIIIFALVLFFLLFLLLRRRREENEEEDVNGNPEK